MGTQLFDADYPLDCHVRVALISGFGGGAIGQAANESRPQNGPALPNTRPSSGDSDSFDRHLNYPPRNVRQSGTTIRLLAIGDEPERGVP